MKAVFILTIVLMAQAFQMKEQFRRSQISAVPKTLQSLGCGEEVGRAINYFDVCTQTDIQVTSQCIQASMNGYYTTQRWESAVMNNCDGYSIWITYVNDCAIQQHSFGPNRWDYFAWRIR